MGGYDDDRDEEERNEDHLLEGEVELWRNAQWRVTSHVLEEIPSPDAMGGPYYIYTDLLADPGLVSHMCSKNWVDRRLFVEAYKMACELNGVEPLSVGPNDEPLTRSGMPFAEYEVGIEKLMKRIGWREVPDSPERVRNRMGTAESAAQTVVDTIRTLSNEELKLAIVASQEMTMFHANEFGPPTYVRIVEMVIREEVDRRRL